jgi:hypothetical protein
MAASNLWKPIYRGHLECVPGVRLASSSILLRQHDRDDPLGDGGIGGVGRVHRQVAIEIIDLEHDGATVDFKGPKVVLLVRVVGVAKVVKHRDGFDDPLDGLWAERRSASVVDQPPIATTVFGHFG